MTYTLKMCCGHEEKVSLHGNRRQKEIRANWLQKGQPCSQCILLENQEKKEETIAR